MKLMASTSKRMKQEFFLFDIALGRRDSKKWRIPKLHGRHHGKLRTSCARLGLSWQHNVLSENWAQAVLIVHRGTSDSFDRSGRKRISPRDDWRIRESYLLWVLFIHSITLWSKKFRCAWFLAHNDCATGVRTQYCREIGVCQKTDSNSMEQYNTDYCQHLSPKTQRIRKFNMQFMLASDLRLFAWAIFVQLWCN